MNPRMTSADKIASVAPQGRAPPRRSKQQTRARPDSKAEPSGNTSNAVTTRHIIAKLSGFFASLKLTVVCLSVGIVLVFTGTLAQVDLGLFKAQNEFFRNFFVYWPPKGAAR